MTLEHISRVYVKSIDSIAQIFSAMLTRINPD